MIYATKRAKFYQMKERGVVHAGRCSIKKRVLLERGMHVGKLSIEKGWFMQFNCFRFVRFNRFNRKGSL